MWPKEYGRFNIFFEKHIGIGLRWDSYVYSLEISIAIFFITFTLGFGKKLDAP